MLTISIFYVLRPDLHTTEETKRKATLKGQIMFINISNEE